MRSLVAAAFCFARAFTSALADRASTVSPSSLRVFSMSAWMSSLPASGPGSGPGGGAVLSAVIARVLHYVDVLFDVRNGLRRGGGGLGELLLADQSGDARDGEEGHGHDERGLPHRQHQ